MMVETASCLVIVPTFLGRLAALCIWIIRLRDSLLEFPTQSDDKARDGLVRNVLAGRETNELDNLGLRGQLLFLP